MYTMKPYKKKKLASFSCLWKNWSSSFKRVSLEKYLALNQGASGLNQIIDNYYVATIGISLLDPNCPLIAFTNFIAYHLKLQTWITFKFKQSLPFTSEDYKPTMGKWSNCLWNRFQAPSSGNATTIWERTTTRMKISDIDFRKVRNHLSREATRLFVIEVA